MPIKLSNQEKSAIADITHKAVTRYHLQPAHACAYYAVVGQALIASLTGLDCRPVIGSLIAGSYSLQFSLAGRGNFHCWLENGAELIDLSARHYPVKTLVPPYLWATAAELRRLYSVEFIPYPQPGLTAQLLHQLRKAKREQIKAMLDYAEQNAYT